jgi:choline dehydrogenase-like flavoprotein
VGYRAPEVVLCAGGIKSPHLLMLSGVGPAAQLREHGIDVVRDSPGVGQGAKDHPSVQVDFRVSDDGEPLPDNFMAFQTCLNHTAPGSDVEGDLQITCGAASYRKLFGAMTTTDGKRARVPSYLKRPLTTLRALRRLPVRLVARQAAAQDNLMLLCSLDAERSSGEIVLRSADPEDAPGIELNYLTDPADLPRMVANVRVAVALLGSPGFAALGLERIAPDDAALASDAALSAWIRANLSTSLHTSCTARMGPADDATAVVDQHGRVHGVEGLRVADISIMPTIVRRGPAATAVMIGERMAELMNDER